MQIVGFEIFPVRVPLRRKITWARSDQESMDQVYLRVVTDEGISGLSEGLAYPPWSGETLQSIVVTLREFIEPQVVGLDPLSYRSVWSVLDTIHGHQTPKSMVEAAVIEICAKTAGLPCWQWLGGSSDVAPLSWIVTRQDADTMVNDAVSTVEQFGFKCLKIKVGRDPNKDIDVIRRVRGELGNAVKIYVDGNSGYSPAQAQRVSHALAEYDVLYMEDPCYVESVEQFKLLSAGLTVPMLMDRPCQTVPDYMAYMGAGALAAGIKLGRLGYRNAGFVAELGKRLGTSVCIGYHGEAHFGCITAAHFANGLLGDSELPAEVSFFIELKSDLCDPPLELKDGSIILSDRPGYGVNLNEELLERYAV